MFTKILKRDGTKEIFQPQKITDAIFKAVKAVGGNDYEKASQLANQVIEIAHEKYKNKCPKVEDIQDIVESVLIKNGHDKTAKAYILYREKRKAAREHNALIGATIDMFSTYLNDDDWVIKENANAQKSVNGLNNYVRESFTKQYWLHEIYSDEIRKAHLSGDCHIHDLGFFGGYCAGWDLRQLLLNGFGGIKHKVESKPPKHLRSFLGQIVNSTFTTQGETAGAQAWSSFDTYCAPFIRKDSMTYEQVRQNIQEFIFNINVPTRVGFQCPFSNLTFDIKVPNTLKDHPIIIGGKYEDTTYGEYQKEMDIFNAAFCDVMMEGDAKGRVFTFPIPTLNITKDFDWNNPVVDKFMEITCKYGIPYFANYVTSDLSPDDAVSMCPLTANTQVLVRNRYGEISNINIKQLTENNIEYEVWNGYKWVKATFNKVDRDIAYDIELSNGVSVSMGHCHLQPLLRENKFQTLQAHKIKIGDWIPFNKNAIESGQNNYDLGYFVGAYIGDGSHDKGAIIFSLSKTKLDTMEFVIKTAEKNLGFRTGVTSDEINYSVRISNGSYDFIKRYVSGDTAHTKRLTNACFEMSADFKRGLIDGYEGTDGSRSKHRIYSCNIDLLKDVQNLAATCGIKALLRSEDNRDGRYSNNPVFRLDVPQRLSYGEFFKEDENWIYYKVENISTNGQIRSLYCAETNDDNHLFMLSNGLITHNCRLRLDVSELRKRGGGLFGSNPLTGSIGVFTINLPRIGYLSDTKEEFFERLRAIATIGKESLEIKRKILEEQTEKGLYPYSAVYLNDVKKKSGHYWYNHFNTIGLIGMHEALLNFIGKGIETPEGNQFAIEVMNYLRVLMIEFQKETGNQYNLEATPAEGTSYRLARLDKERYPEIITSGKNVPYYTNSSQLPVGYTDDIREMCDLQDELQSLYTGGTVSHLYLGERIEDISTAKQLIQKIFSTYKMPYVSLTPTFSICDEHGYISGEHFTCPECGAKTEVWSRVVGYLRPVQNYNEGKQEEYGERKKFVLS